MRLIICKGLPASGKTTWAKEYVATHRSTIRLNWDDLRHQFFDGKHTRAKEGIVKAARDVLVLMALEQNQSVVVDDTNLHPSNEERLRELAEESGAIVEIREFRVPVKECIRRDRLREKPVGAKVIREFAELYGWG